MKAAMSLYVLVADFGRARIYRTRTPVLGLNIVYNQTNFTGSKNPGRHQQTRTGLQQNTTPFAQATRVADDRDTFVCDVCKVLQNSLLDDAAYEALVLIAPGELLDRFRRLLDQQCQNLLAGTIIKPPGPMTEQEVIRALEKL